MDGRDEEEMSNHRSFPFTVEIPPGRFMIYRLDSTSFPPLMMFHSIQLPLH